MTEWLKTMYAIRGIQSVFSVTVFGQVPQMVGWLERDFKPANGNRMLPIIRPEELPGMGLK